MSDKKLEVSVHPKFDKHRRLLADLTSKMSEGKITPFRYGVMLIILSLWGIRLINAQKALERPSVLRGGLVFTEENQNDPIFINQEFYTMVRYADTDQLCATAQLSADLLSEYATHCTHIANKANEMPPQTTPKPEENLSGFELDKPKTDFDSHPYDITVGNIKIPLVDTPNWCHRTQAHPIEIRDTAQMARVRNTMIYYNITVAYANIYWDKASRMLRYRSDEASVQYHTPFKEIHYGGSYGMQDNKGPFDGFYAKQESERYPILYKNPQGEFHIRISAENEMREEHKYICQRPRTTNNKVFYHHVNTFTLLAHHACLRDGPGLRQEVRARISDMETMFKLKLNISYDRIIENSFFPKGVHKTKRESSDYEANYSDYLEYSDDTPNNNPTDDEFIVISVKPDGSLDIKSEDDIPAAKQLTESVMDSNDPIQEETTAKQLSDPMTDSEEDDITTAKQLQPQPTPDFIQNNPVQSDNETETEEIPSNRTKRAVPALGTLPLLPLVGVFAGSNIISSLVNNEAPLSWFGKAIGGTLGLATSSEVDALATRLTGMSQSIESLKINKEEVQKAVLDVKRHVEEFRSLILSAHTGNAWLTMEQDIKGMIRHLTNLQQATILKFANIIVASNAGTVSPFAITNDEFKQIVTEVRNNKKIQLDDKLSKVQMMAAIQHNRVRLFFQIPIMNEMKSFTFFKVQALPIFDQNATYIPEFDTPYIGLSQKDSEYIVVSSDEYTRCINDPLNCVITSPTMPITKNSHCAVTTFTTQRLTCPLREIDNLSRPEIINTGNHTIYSVQRPTRLFIKCDDLNKEHKFIDDSTTIEGMGQISFRAGCTITAPDGTKWTTPSAYPLDVMPPNTALFSLLRVFPVPTSVVVILKDRPEIPITLHGNFSSVSSDTIPEMAAQAFETSQYPIFLMRASTVIGFVILVLVIICCIRNSCKNHPDEFQDEEKAPKQEDKQERIDYLYEQLATLRDSLSSTYKGLSGSSRSFSNPLTTSQSCSELTKPTDDKVHDEEEANEPLLEHARKEYNPDPIPKAASTIEMSELCLRDLNKPPLTTITKPIPILKRSKPKVCFGDDQK